MWHLWQDQIQGIGIGGCSTLIWLLKLKASVGFARGLGRLGRCRGVRGDVRLAGELGPESMRRLEVSKGTKEGLSLTIGKIVQKHEPK